MDKDWTGNRNSVWKTLGASNHAEEERAVSDFYATDAVALEKLAARCSISHKVYECACGDGSLSKWLVEHGHDVLSTDLVDRGYGIGSVDFLNMTYEQSKYLKIWAKDEPFDILTNPPYKECTNFILHALDLIPESGRVIMFLKTTYLEGKDRKKRIYDVNPPRWIFQFSERVLCAKNGDFVTTRKKLGNGAQAYCWMVWNKHNDERITEIKWI